MKKVLTLVLLLCMAPLCWGLEFSLPSPDDDVVGEIQHGIVKPGDNFTTIGRRYDVGYYELVEANPGIDPDNPLVGAHLIIPSRFILPPAPRQGIVINLAELRLYYYPAGTGEVFTFPIGIGRQGWDTPQGIRKVGSKTKNPTWYVPDTIRAWKQSQGVTLPKFVPPGPDNPLGNYAMRLSSSTYLIHGTNDPSGIGRRSTSGCIRLFPEDIENLFDMTSVGTPVRILNQPIKLGWDDGKLYVEAHVPTKDSPDDPDLNYTDMIQSVLHQSKDQLVQVNWDVALSAIKDQDGIPHLIAEDSLPLAKPLYLRRS